MHFLLVLPVDSTSAPHFWSVLHTTDVPAECFAHVMMLTCSSFPAFYASLIDKEAMQLNRFFLFVCFYDHKSAWGLLFWNLMGFSWFVCAWCPTHWIYLVLIDAKMNLPCFCDVLHCCWLNWPFAKPPALLSYSSCTCQTFCSCAAFMQFTVIMVADLTSKVGINVETWGLWQRQV